MTLVDLGRAPETERRTLRRTAGRAVSRTVDKAGLPVLRALRELVLVAVLFELYRFGRVLARGQEATAYAHAVDVHEFERVLRLPSEAAIQGLVPSDALLQ